MVIDRYHTAFDIGANARHRSGRRRVCVSRQAIGQPVRLTDRTLIIVEATDNGDRPEGLLIQYPGAKGDVSKNCRLEEITAITNSLPASQHSGAAGDCIRYEGLHRFDPPGVCQGSHRDAIFETISNDQFLSRGYES